MGVNLGSLIQVLGSGYAGYLQGAKIDQEKADAKARQDRLDAQQQEEYDYRKGLRDKETDLETKLAAAGADQTVEAVTPDAGPNAYNPGDMAGGGSSADLSGVNGAPVAPPAAPQPTGYKVGDQTYADQASAQQALRGTNSAAAKNRRRAQVYSDAGQVDKARQYDEFAQQAINEGSDKILGAISAAAPSVADVKKAGGIVTSTVGQEAADVFNQTGGRWNVAPDTKVEHYIDKDATGREFVNSRVIGANGQPLVDDVHHAGLMLQDFKTRQAAQQAETNAYQTEQQIAESARHNKVGEVETAANNQALRGIQYGQLALAQKKDQREATLFKNQTPEGQLEQLQAALGPLSDADKKAYRLKLLNLGTNKASDDALIGDLTKKYQENNPTATAQDVAKYRGDLTTSFAQAGNNRQVEARLSSAFSKAAPGTPEYAKTWNDAKTDLGMTDAQLSALGYTAPSGTPGTPGIAARGTMARIPEPPTERVWVGNTNQENPAFTAWKQQYGSDYQQARDAENARLVSGYERMHD